MKVALPTSLLELSHDYRRVATRRRSAYTPAFDSQVRSLSGLLPSPGLLDCTPRKRMYSRMREPAFARTSGFLSASIACLPLPAFDPMKDKSASNIARRNAYNYHLLRVRSIIMPIHTSWMTMMPISTLTITSLRWLRLWKMRHERRSNRHLR